MTKLRTIPFVESADCRIDRQGRVHSLKRAKGRARGLAAAKWSLCAPLALDQATHFARVTMDYPFELVVEEPEVIIVLHADGRREEFKQPYKGAECIRHNSKDPPERAGFKGGSVRAVGDLTRDWYCIDADGTKHLFHGPSVAAEVFAKDA